MRTTESSQSTQMEYKKYLNKGKYRILGHFQIGPEAVTRQGAYQQARVESYMGWLYVTFKFITIYGKVKISLKITLWREAPDFSEEGDYKAYGVC